MRRLIPIFLALAACAGPTATTTTPSTTTTTASTTTATQPITTTTECDIPISERVGHPWECRRASISLDNFSIEIIITGSQCFGSAGANVEWEPRLTVDIVPPDDYRATLVYELHGGDQVDIYNIEIEGSGYTYNGEFTSIDTCDYELTAVPVRLLER